MSKRTLLVGLDLGERYSQLAVYDPVRVEADLMCQTEENPEGYIETSVSLEGKEPIRDFWSRIKEGRTIEVDGRESSPVNVLAYFFRKTLALTRKKYPSETIKQLVVTTEGVSEPIAAIIYEALAKLNINKDRALVMERKQCFAYYVMYQSKELWTNDVGLFDYHDRVLNYYQLQLDRRKTPVLVSVHHRPLQDAADMMEKDPEHKGVLFENAVQGLIHKQILSSLYMTGEGFEEEWCQDVFKQLCVGRRLFLGNNLFVSGACFAAREMGEDRRLQEYLMMDENMVSSRITMDIYRHGKQGDCVLVKAGEPWFQVKKELEVIPDGDEELCLRIYNAFTKEDKKILVELEPVQGRVDRHCRLGLKLLFTDAHTCVLTIRDMGFGEEYPSSNRIWEKVLQID